MSCIALLQDLVRLPSVNPMGRSWASDAILYEHRVTAYLEDYFRKLGVSCERQRVAPNRDNIMARFDSPGAKHTLLFEVHQDTVPVDAMTIEPFGGEIRDGKLYGRGACDVKGSMAVMLSVLRGWREKSRKGRATSSLPARSMKSIRSSACRNWSKKCGPTSRSWPNRLCCKSSMPTRGSFAGRCGLRRACHSSRPDQGTNAIYRMGKLLTAVEEYASVLSAKMGDARLGSPTLSVGRIDGGTSVNTVPDDCVIEIDRRLLPGENPARAPREFEEFLKNHSLVDFPFTCEPVWLECPPLNADRSGELTQRLGQAIDVVLGSHRVIAVPFGTDASTIAEAGIPSVVFGPGDIAQAHTRDEWIEIEQLGKAEEILWKLLAKMD